MGDDAPEISDIDSEDEERLEPVDTTPKTKLNKE
jgi:hypothetical protein